MGNSPTYVPYQVYEENVNFQRVQSEALGTLATFDVIKDYQNNEGSLANNLIPQGSGDVNVVNDYMWTLSNKKRDDVPKVILKEYRVNETQIKQQLDLYSKLTPQTFLGAIGKGAEKRAVLDVYTEIFSKDFPTEWIYTFPYFNKTAFELSTPNWQQLDPIGESLKTMAGGASNFLENFGSIGKSVAKGINLTAKALEGAQAAAETSLMWQYPSVGVADRPRVFAGHNERQITISFPLFNTVNEWDWTKNRDLVYLLMSQNLFNKRDYITGVPPVFYDVYIPGQYYCYAAAMTNINIENLGNTRLFYDEYIIPDAYQVTLTLTEMVTPSKNQFEAITSGAAKNFVKSTVQQTTETALRNLARAEQASRSNSENTTN